MGVARNHFTESVEHDKEQQDRWLQFFKDRNYKPLR